jgi:hypothetical protein
MQPQDFDVLATHTIDGDGVLMRHQFAGASTQPASPLPVWTCNLVIAYFNTSMKQVARVWMSLVMNPTTSSTLLSTVLATSEPWTKHRIWQKWPLPVLQSGCEGLRVNACSDDYGSHAFNTPYHLYYNAMFDSHFEHQVKHEREEIYPSLHQIELQF